MSRRLVDLRHARGASRNGGLWEHGWRAACLMFGLLLSGCQSVPKPVDVAPETWILASEEFAGRVLEVAALAQWHYSAKASIKSSDGSDQFNLDWRYVNGRHSIQLFGPLGVGAVRLDYSANEARLSDNKGELYEGPDAATLLTEITGLTLPIEALEYWLFAIPSPNAVARYQLSPVSNREIHRIQQLGWQTTFADYQAWGTETELTPIGISPQVELAVVEGSYTHEIVRLPRRITAIGRGPNGTRVEVRIVSKLWQF